MAQGRAGVTVTPLSCHRDRSALSEFAKDQIAIVMGPETRLAQRPVNSVGEEGDDDLTRSDRSKLLSDRRGRMRLKCIQVKALVHACFGERARSWLDRVYAVGPLRLLSILVPA